MRSDGPTWDEQDELEEQDTRDQHLDITRCPHCKLSYPTDCTVLICEVCHKAYWDPTVEEEKRMIEEEKQMLLEIYRGIRRGTLP